MEVTRYEYDEDGRLAGSVTEREPEWSRADVEALIAFCELRRVGPHGHPMDVATSRDGDPSNPDRKWKWVPIPTIDFAQKAINDAKNEYATKYKDADLSAYRWRVERREI